MPKRVRAIGLGFQKDAHEVDNIFHFPKEQNKRGPFIRTVQNGSKLPLLGLTALRSARAMKSLMLKVGKTASTVQYCLDVRNGTSFAK